MKITVDVTGDNEATESPWWAIVDPKQNMAKDLNMAASQITGPFFSRAEAEDFLKATHYNFSKRAAVWCFSGYYSRQYKEACRTAAKTEQGCLGPNHDAHIIPCEKTALELKRRQALKECAEGNHTCCRGKCLDCGAEIG